MNSSYKFIPERRHFLRNSLLFCAAIGTAPLLAPQGATGASAGLSGQNPLVVYFSLSGNTQKVAEEIHKLVGGNMIQIETVEAYPREYRATTEKAKEEQATNARPAIKTIVPDMDKYSIVFLGYPNWWSSMPMPVYTFIEQSGLNGKIIAPFSTNGGGGLGHSIQDLEKLCPKSKILPALAVNGSRAGASSAEVAAWLKEIGAAI